MAGVRLAVRPPARPATSPAPTTRPPSTSRHKADNSPVTVADKRAEQLIRDAVAALPARRLPGRGVRRPAGHERLPLGHRPHRRHQVVRPPHPASGPRSSAWSTGASRSAASRTSRCSGMTYRALRGDGAYHERPPHPRLGRRRPRRVADLLFQHRLVPQAGREQDVPRTVPAARTRQRGYGDFYGFVLVAEGAAEMMVEHGVNPWDVAATKAIVEEAGGRFTDWDGTPTIHRPDVLATNGKVHAEALAILRKPRACILSGLPTSMTADNNKQVPPAQPVPRLKSSSHTTEFTHTSFPLFGFCGLVPVAARRRWPSPLRPTPPTGPRSRARSCSRPGRTSPSGRAERDPGQGPLPLEGRRSSTNR